MDAMTFLTMYGLVTAGAITGARWLARQGVVFTTEAPPLPEPPDPYQAAWLRGGDGEALRLALFEVNRAARSGGPPMQSALAKAVGSPDLDPKSLFQLARDSTSTAADELGRIRLGLEEAGLAIPTADRIRARRLAWGAALVILVLGVARIVESVQHGHFNLLYTIGLGILGLILVRIVVPLPRLTPAGRRQLERYGLLHGLSRGTSTRQLDQVFTGTGSPSLSPSPTPTPAVAGGADLALLAVGTLGFGVLAGTTFDHLSQQYERAAKDTGAGGCGSSGCGSVESSSSGMSSTGSSCGSSDSGSGGASGCGGGGCGGGGD